jgi:hypothetical protein
MTTFNPQVRIDHKSMTLVPPSEELLAAEVKTAYHNRLTIKSRMSQAPSHDFEIFSTT